MPESLVLEALSLARSEARRLQQPQLALAAAMGKRKEGFPLSGADPQARAKVFQEGRSLVEGVFPYFPLVFCLSFDGQLYWRIPMTPGKSDIRWMVTHVSDDMQNYYY